MAAGRGGRRQGQRLPPGTPRLRPVLQISFIYLAKSTRKTLLALATVCAVTLLLVCSGAFFPYSSQPASPRPKRVFLQVRSAASPEGVRGGGLVGAALGCGESARPALAPERQAGRG